METSNTSPLLERLTKYSREWNAAMARTKQFPCTIPIIGVFFEIYYLRHVEKITKDYERYLNENKSQ